MRYCQGCGRPITQHTDAIPYGKRDVVCSRHCAVEADKLWGEAVTTAVCWGGAVVLVLTLVILGATGVIG